VILQFNIKDVVLQNPCQMMNQFRKEEEEEKEKRRKGIKLNIEKGET